MNVGEVLEKVRQRYAIVSHYSDRGEFDAFADGVVSMRGSFRTAFVRARGLRFEFRVTDQYGATHEFSYRADSQRILEARGTRSNTSSIGGTIGAMKGVTFSTGFTVPRMLLPDQIWGHMLCDCSDAELERTEELDGDHCLVIAPGPPHGEHSVYIRSTDFALLRVVSRLEVTTHTLETARKLRPALDVAKLQLGAWSQVITYAPEFPTSERPGIDPEWVA